MKYALFLCLALITLSCFEQGDCSDISSDRMQVNFFNFSDKKAKGILFDSIKTDGWDTVLTASLSGIKLPLNPQTDTMTFHFYYEKKHALLGISYEIKTFALAPDCKAIDLITLLDANQAIIQDFKISQPKITRNVSENIKLYF
jgi:Family of unknown function (DUF6452)